MSIQQNKYLIAYLDLLGVAEKLNNTETASNMIQVAYDMVRNANRNMNNHIMQYKAFAFSDNLAFCVPLAGTQYKNELFSLAYMMADFIWINSGFPSKDGKDNSFMTPIRGAITIGDLFIDVGNNFIMGEALARVYKLESKEAKYPRIIIDKNIDGICSEDTVFRKCNDDNYYYVDFLSHKFSEDSGYDKTFAKIVIKSYVEMIKNEIVEYRNKNEKIECSVTNETVDNRLLKKYQWLAGEYCNGFFDKNPYYSDLRIDDSFLD